MPSTAKDSEPLLQEEEDRRSLFPLRDEKAFRFYQQLEGLRWPVRDIEAQLSDDRDHWRNRLTPADRAFYLPILAMLVAGDRVVNENLDTNFLSNIKSEEVCMAYGAQRAQESVHNETYSVIPRAILSDEETAHMLSCLDASKALGRLVAWAQKWTRSEAPLGQLILAFAFFEGVVFQAMFMSIQMLKERNLMPAFTTANELIARDENVHCLLACYLLCERVRVKPSQSSAHAMLAEVVSIVGEFLQEACQAARDAAGTPAAATCPVERISYPELMQYLRFVGDTVLEHLQYDKVYQAANPYPESHKLQLNNVLKSNFFEVNPTQYNHDFDLTFDFDDGADPVKAEAEIDALYA